MKEKIQNIYRSIHISGYGCIVSCDDKIEESITYHRICKCVSDNPETTS